MDAIESFGEVTIDGGFGIEVAQESTPGAGDFDANVLMAVEIQDDPDGIDSRARRLR